MLEEDYFFNCPYCSVEISIRLDHTAGKRQEFSYDCENCCRPIAVRVVMEEEEVLDFSAERELD